MLFTVPIFYSQLTMGSPQMRHQQWDCYAVFTVLVMAMMIRNIFVSSFLLLSLAHFFFFQNPFSETHLFQTVVSSLVFYVFSTYEIKNYKETLLGLFILNISMATVQHLGLDVYTWMTWSENGMLGLPAYLGIFSALVTPLVCTISPWFLVLGIIGVFWSKSMFCVLALSVSMFFYGLRFWDKRVLLLLVSLGLLVIPLALQDNHVQQSSRRLPVWKMVASKAFRNPFFGWGMGSFDQQMVLEFNDKGKRQWFQAKEVPENYEAISAKLYDIQAQTGEIQVPYGHDKDSINQQLSHIRSRGIEIYRWDSPHSHYLDVFFGYGFIGMFLLIGFIREKLSMIYSTFLCLDKECIALGCSFIALLIVSLVHFPLSVAKLNVICVALIGALDRKLHHSSKTS